MSTLHHPAALSAPTRVYPLRAMLICIVGALLTAIIPTVEHAYLYTLVSLMLFCVVAPVWYCWFRGRLDFFEPVHIMGLRYFVFFGLGAIWTVQDPGDVAYDLQIVPYVPKAVLYCLLGYVAMLVGYFAFWRDRPDLRRTPEWPQGAMFLLICGGLGLAGQLAWAVWVQAMWRGHSLTAAISSLGQLAPIFMFAWCLAWMLYFSGKATFGQRLVLFGVMVPGTVAIGLLNFSDKSLAMTLLVVPIIARWYAVRKIPWAFLLVLLLVLMFVIFPFYNTYRWSDPGLSQGERMSQTYLTIQDWNSETYVKWSVGTFKRRLAMINSMAVVVRDVPRWVPYAKGETLFLPTLAFFVPRVLWEDKPMTNLGKEFVRTFRTSGPIVSEHHNVAATIPGELFWNFDLLGVLVGMTLLGLAVRGLYRWYGPGAEVDPVRQSIHVFLLIEYVHLGGALAPAVVQIVRTLVILAVLRWFGRQHGMLAGRPAAPQVRPSVAVAG